MIPQHVEIRLETKCSITLLSQDLWLEGRKGKYED